ncbi:MAG TPA: hypothetical protein VIO86_00440 [Candidatus Dormibacteraeota bacterium]
MEAPPGPLRSPDGLWWWDGKAWQPIASLGVPPPPPPPTANPEPAKQADPSSGAWQPPAAVGQPASEGWQVPPAAAEAPGTRESSAAAPSPSPAQPTEEVPRFGAWQPPPEFAPQPQPPPPAAPAQPTAAAAQPPPAPPPPPAREADVPWPNWLPRTERSEAMVEDVPSRVAGAATTPPPQPAPQPVAPLQAPPGARSSSWMEQLYPASAALNANRRLVAYVGLGILGLIALYVLVQVLGQMGLFTPRTTLSGPDAGPTGTQFQQADGFLSGTLNPALESVTTAVTPIPTDCGGTHSVTCRGTLENADTALVKAIAAIDKGGFPNCLAASVVQSRRDLVNLDQAIKTALIGFGGNSDALVTKGLAEYSAASPTLKADGDALKAAEQSACPKTP